MKTVFEFKCGDRVRFPDGELSFVVEYGPGRGDFTLSEKRFAEEHGATLVSRPMYPEPGQVVVALSQAERAMIYEAAEALECEDDRQGSNEISQTLRAILARVNA